MRRSAQQALAAGAALAAAVALLTSGANPDWVRAALGTAEPTRALWTLSKALYVSSDPAVAGATPQALLHTLIVEAGTPRMPGEGRGIRRRSARRT